MKIKYIFGLVCFIFVIADLSGETVEENEVFVATKEWKVVKKGKKIPKGLHVRVNFETGITEAKLLDETEDTKSNALTASPEDPLSGIEIKSRKKFKTYDEIKKDLDDINLTAKTDAEVLKTLFKEFQANGPSIKIFEDLEFLAHQYDNALNFVNLKGFKEIIYKTLNTTISNEFKKESLILLGSLAQNNPTVQIRAIKTGSLNILLRLLTEKEFKSETVFALGSVLRRFPWAQLKFVEIGGLGTLINLLDNAEIKIGIKVVTLLDDLIAEGKSAKEEGDASREKLEQYNKVDIKAKLVDGGYCGSIERFFVKLVLVDENDFDAIERCLGAMRGVITECKYNFKNLRKMFDALRKKHGEESVVSLIDEMIKDEL